MGACGATLVTDVGEWVKPGLSTTFERSYVMATKNLTAETFAEVAGGDGIVLVDFWAAWCGPCLRFAPVYERVSEKHEDIVFAKVDTEAEPALQMEFGIQSIPTIMAIRDGVLVFQQAGALPESALESLISQVRGLDMDEVRAHATAA
jgi:thioredoxin 1